MIANKQYLMTAKTMAGLENVLAEELKQMGGAEIKVMNRAVSFVGDKGFMYKANLRCRTALRILKPIKEFYFSTETDFYDAIYKINWDRILDADQTLAVDSFINESVFTNSFYVAQRTKDAIVDKFRSRCEERPDVDIKNPDVRINIHINKSYCTVSLDSSGESLHKRGYRLSADVAPINEVLAAGMILLSEWDGKSHFVDFMCGSATIPVEAAMIALNLPAGYYRNEFGFEKWKDFDKELYDKIYEISLDKVKDIDFKIHASDISPKALEIASANIKYAKLEDFIELKQSSFEDIIPPKGKGMLVCNPPYGERIKTDDNIEFYKKIGDALKKNFVGYDAWIISSDLEAIKSIELKTSRKIHLFNGPLECRFNKYSIFEGSLKNK